MKSKHLLFFLIPAFIAALIYGYLQMPRQERISTVDGKVIQRPQTKKQLQGQKGAAIGKEGYPRLRTDLLEHKSQPYPGVRRNLFTSLTRRQVEEVFEVPPPEPVEVITLPVIVETEPPPPPPPAPQEIVRRDLGRYKFLGYLKKGVKKTIFLSTEGEILLVRQGEYLGRDKTYYVVNITDTTLELRTKDAGDFLIKLTDQETLSADPVRAAQSLPAVTPHPLMPEQEGYLPDLPEFQTIHDEAPPTDDQLQPEEDN